MTVTSTLVLYCAIILVVSILGGVLPAVAKMTHRRLQFGLALVAGVMLGVGFLHMLGHAVIISSEASHGHGEGPSMSAVLMATLVGFLVMFLLERFFCFHHHEVEGEDGHTCGHSHTAGEECAEDAPGSAHTLGWIGAFVGMSVHTILAGFALAATVIAGNERMGPTPDGMAVAAPVAEGLLGFGVFLGIVLHKPFDSFTVVALMRKGAMSPFKMHLVNVLFALLIPVGVLIYILSANAIQSEGTFAALALAFSAGTFICIASSDLLPELQMHNHDRFGITAMLLIGLGIAWASGLFEHGHAHDHDHGGGTVEAEVAPAFPDSGPLP